MNKKAKTYRSTNGWTGPESLSDFGIPIICKSKSETLGLEEFNGIKLLRKHKLAFIPAFSVARNFVVDELKLFYSVPGRTFHYGTMKNVEQIHATDVDAIRANELRELPTLVSESLERSAIFSDCHRYAFDVWKKYYNSSNILARGKNLRFVVNVKYESFEIFENPMPVRWTNLMFAKALYP